MSLSETLKDAGRKEARREGQGKEAGMNGGREGEAESAGDTERGKKQTAQRQ